MESQESGTLITGFPAFCGRGPAEFASIEQVRETVLAADTGDVLLAIHAYTFFLDDVLGNDTTAVMGDPSKPFASSNALYIALFDYRMNVNISRELRIHVTSGTHYINLDAGVMFNVIIYVEADSYLSIGDYGTNGAAGTAENPTGGSGSPNYGGDITVLGAGQFALTARGGNGGNAYFDTGNNQNGTLGVALSSWTVRSNQGPWISLDLSGGDGGSPSNDQAYGGLNGGASSCHFYGVRGVLTFGAGSIGYGGLMDLPNLGYFKAYNCNLSINNFNDNNVAVYGYLLQCTCLEIYGKLNIQMGQTVYYNLTVDGMFDDLGYDGTISTPSSNFVLPFDFES